jgi:iron complex transport system substrate-binding protein
VRIVSLLPSLSELVCALGHEADLVGVSHECDFPTSIERLPRLTRSLIDPRAPAAEIDRAVAEHGGSLYTVDREALAALRPDLILTQAQCDVCAVNEALVRQIAAELPHLPRVESVNPTDLDGVFAMFDRIASLLSPPAVVAAGSLRRQFDELASRIAAERSEAIPRLIHLEWIDPPYRSGHWNPELVRLAGGIDPLAEVGQPSRRATWHELAAARPEVLLIAPCGFSFERTKRDWTAFARSPEAEPLSRLDTRIVLADGNAYFSRPGPRLIDSFAILAAAIDPVNQGNLTPREGWAAWDSWEAA